MLVILPLNILLVLSLHFLQTNAALFPNAASDLVRRTHRVWKRTSQITEDLNVAMRGVLQSRSQRRNTPVIDIAQTCSINKGPVGNNRGGGSGGGSGSNSTSISTSTNAAGALTEAMSSQVATSSGSITTTPTSTTTRSPSPTPTLGWKLVESHSGTNFFDGWSFSTGADSSTGGIVEYVDQGTAQSSNLISINSAGHAIMSVETTAVVPSTRKSVRITTNTQYTGAIWLLDAVHMPTGCATWPAFWTAGPGWPNAGEIDIIEGVDDYTNNQATLHSTPGCYLNTQASFSGTSITGSDCSASGGQVGCGIRSNDPTSFGAAFNSVGGGVYAMKWDSSGIAIYFFPRSSIPGDISNGTLLPQNWGTPMAFWDASSCNPYQFFNSHSAIFDTTLCGGLGDGVWGVAGAPGQAQSCATRTGFSSCEAFVQASGASFDQAYWEVVSVKIYQQ